MLIAAIPKSASTSLMSTLGQLHDLPASQSFFDQAFERRPKPAGYARLPDYHFDVRQLDEALSHAVTAPGRIAKHHVPPTPGNLELLADHAVVVLLRNPVEIVRAYRRGVRNRVHNPMAGFEGCRMEDDWMRRARSIGLLDDLERFHDGWLTYEGRSLIVWYEELVRDPTAVVHEIETYWGLPHVSDDVFLARERYSRGGPLARWFRGIDATAGAAAVNVLSTVMGRDSRLYRDARRCYRVLRERLID